MKVIHVSEIYNRKSILLNGLRPSNINHPNHLESLKEADLCTKDNKILYTWESCDKDTQFIKDMVFCKAYILPRNEMSYETNFSKLVDKFLGRYTNMTYDVYEISVPEQRSIFYHEQTPCTCIHSPCFDMPLEFSHDDKPLHFYKTPQIDLRIVGQAELEYAKGKYRIKVK